MATVTPYPNFDANEDAQILHDAMKGIGSDKDTITEILANRTVNQRREIADSYKAQFGEDLIEKFEKELKGDFEEVVISSFRDRAQINAAALEKAMKGAGTDENMLIEVICTASCNKINAIKMAYEEMFGKNLEEEIESEVSGDFKRVLIAILQGCRQKGCNPAQAEVDAQELLEAGEEKIGTDESTFNRLICNSSFKQIKLINECYADLTGHDLIEAIDKELSGDHAKALKCVVSYAMDRLGTVSDILYRSMKGLGTHDASLIRIILGYSEDGLELIKEYFDTHYDKTLAEMVEDDTSGDYKKFLLAIIG